MWVSYVGRFGITVDPESVLGEARDAFAKIWPTRGSATTESRASMGGLIQLSGIWGVKMMNI
jgi:hypothetical protein